MYPWYRESVAAAAAAGLGGPVGVVGSGFCSSAPGQGGTTIKTETGYSDCMLALDYVQSKVSPKTPVFLTFVPPVFSPHRRSAGGSWESRATRRRRGAREAPTLKMYYYDDTS